MIKTLKIASKRALNLTNLSEALGSVYGEVPAFFPDVFSGGDFSSIISNGGGITFPQLVSITNRIANFLVGEVDLRKGERVLAQFENQAALFLVMLGTIKAGGIAVPVDSSTLSSEKEFIRDHCDARIMVTDKEISNKKGVWVSTSPGEYMEALDGTGRSLSSSISLNERLYETSDFFIPYTLKRSSLVSLFYVKEEETDGNTPEMLGVMGSNGTLVGTQRRLAPVLSFLLRKKRSPLALIATPVNSAGGFSAWIFSLLAGLIVQAACSDPAKLIGNPSLLRADVFVASPDYYRKMVSDGFTSSDFPLTGLFISWGGFLTEEVARSFLQGGDVLIEAWGEVKSPPPVFIATTGSEDRIGSQVRCWAPPPVHMGISSHEGDLSREVGSLTIKGVDMAPGFWMDIERTSRWLGRRELETGLYCSKGHFGSVLLRRLQQV